jgi:phosphoribosylformylglycinamidine cyclo-ligase
VLVIPAEQAEQALKVAEEHGELAYRIGTVTAGNKIVTFEGVELP